MSLTRADAPLAGGDPALGNYTIDGPAHRLHAHPFPHRVRALLGGTTVLDTTAGMLLHETGLLPVLYAPSEDLDLALLERTERSSHCPFKGDASYWTVRANGSEAQHAVWGYEDPLEPAAWLRGHRAVYWDAMDSWFDEDEEVFAHLRDPFHRVDARRSSRHLRVLAGDAVVADTTRPVIVFETGLPPRYYLPADDVLVDLEPSERTAACPYKGQSSYRSARVGERLLEDAAWTYERPLEGVSQVAGLVCLLHDELTLEVDGDPA